MSSKSGNKQTDDLTSITGIGRATANSLRKLSVRSFGDLAALSVDEVEAGLKRSNGRAIPRKQIEGWLAQARELAGDAVPAPKRDQAADQERGARKAGSSRRGKWKPFATFVVEFQARNGAEEKRTVCHQHETAKERKWPGIDSERLAAWMLEQLGEEVPEEIEEQRVPDTTPPEASSTAEEVPAVVATVEAARDMQTTGSSPVTVEITQIRMFQPPSGTPRLIATSDEGFGGVLRSGEPVLFELSLQLAGPGATETARSRTRLSAEIYAHNRSTAVNTNLSEPGFTREGQFSYTTVLPEAVLERGAYRLECLATLDATPRRQSYLRVPVIRVV